MPTEPTGDFRHLADVVLRERGARTQRQVQDAAHIGRTTMGKLESGLPHSYGPIVRSKVERAFRWETGEFQRVLEGAEPRHLPDPLQARLNDVWPRLSEGQQQLLVEVAERTLHGS